MLADKILIHGETGTGKTELAKMAAKIATGKEALLVRGFGGMDSRELFGHMQLSAKGIENAYEVPEIIQAKIEKWSELNPDQSEEAQEKAKEQITLAILAQQKVTISEYIIGAVYRAAKEGRNVILDEVNYIPPALMSKLNDIMTKKPGEYIYVQEDGIDPIPVAEGFSITMTGNVNIGKGKRYKQRYDFDLALKDRVKCVEYNYLPQTVKGAIEQSSVEDKQQFVITVCNLLAPRTTENSTSDIRRRLEDRIGSLFIPGGKDGLDKLWRFAQFAAVTQEAFSGNIESLRSACISSRWE